MSKATVMAVVNQKGGTGKTTTCENLGIGLAQEGKRVLLVDTDPQASLTIALGHPRPDEIPITLTDLMAKVMQDQPIGPKESILSHEEGVDLIPANIALSGMEVSLVNAMSRETVLRQVLEPLKSQYDYILLDCMPSLGMLMLAIYDITADRLHADAMEAAVRNRPAKLQNMDDIMREMLGDMSGLFLTDEPSPIWVATVDNGQHGAGVIQYPGFLDQAAETLGGDFYVLPSSVHEVLLVADNGSMELGYLEEMVRSVNAEEVAPAERLSDSVYHYDSEVHIFENARTFEAREAAKAADSHAREQRKNACAEPG